MHKSIDGETANEEGIQSVRPQPCSGEGIDCSPLDDDQTGLTFIAKSSPSSCDVALCSMRSLLSALHYATLTSPFPRPSLRVHFRLRRLSLDRTNEIGRTGGRGRHGRTSRQPPPRSYPPPFALPSHRRKQPVARSIARHLLCPKSRKGRPNVSSRSHLPQTM